MLTRRHPHTEQHTQCRAVTGHTAIADLGKDSPGLGDIVVELIEKAVAHTSAQDSTQDDPHKTRLNKLHTKTLTAYIACKEALAQKERNSPHQAIVAQIKSSYGEHHGIEIPHDV